MNEYTLWHTRLIGGLVLGFIACPVTWMITGYTIAENYRYNYITQLGVIVAWSLWALIPIGIILGLICLIVASYKKGDANAIVYLKTPYYYLAFILSLYIVSGIAAQMILSK